LSQTTLNPCALSLLLFCLGIASLLYIKLSFCNYYSYCQVSLTSILRVTTIGIRAYQFRNTIPLVSVFHSPYVHDPSNKTLTKASCYVVCVTLRKLLARYIIELIFDYGNMKRVILVASTTLHILTKGENHRVRNSSISSMHHATPLEQRSSMLKLHSFEPC